MLINRVLLDRFVRPLLPPEPVLDPVVKEHVVRDVVDFVVAQIDLMPTFLRLPYQIALVGFNWLAILRYGRPYVSLSASRQHTYMHSWRNSSIGVIRDFVKLVQSCVLLQCLDHPLVLKSLSRIYTISLVRGDDE